MDGSFEVVEKDRLKQLKDKFADVVFTPFETNGVEIDLYLANLFPSDHGSRFLKGLRTHVRDICQLWIPSKGSSRISHFNSRSIRWCLKGLLGNDLLSDDKKVILQEFRQDEVAQGEICDVLNMKLANLENWEWDAGTNGLPVEPRRQLNGKYRIMMDEDILDAILLHYIGTKWSVGLKSHLVRAVNLNENWKFQSRVPPDIVDRRRYFLDDDSSNLDNPEGVQKIRRDMFMKDFFLSQMPSSVYEAAGGYEDSEGNQEEEGEEARKGPKEIKQQLLRLLATEVELQKALDGQVAVVQSDFQWFCTGLPHSTILAVLQFMGFPDLWIKFFKKFLEAPLNMGPVSEGEPDSDRARIRKRGVPMAHVLEKFFGEIVLFFMDLAVNQQGGATLYRFHDDLWLVGSPALCASAWQTIEEFTSIMGLQLNKSKTGSVHLKNGDFRSEDSEITAKLPVGPVAIGFLGLDPKTGTWVINQNEVDRHTKQLSQQLAKCTSILSWVQTWNSCIGRFFSHTFGEPGRCFGQAHVDAILKTCKRIQDSIFPDSNVCKHLKGLIEERFQVKDIPDAFFFLPETLGGLGIRNPFIGPLLVREGFHWKTPTQGIEDFLESERIFYEQYRKEFEQMSQQAKKKRFRMVYTDEYGDIPSSASLRDLQSFMTFEEFMKYRETLDERLARVYSSMMEVPYVRHVRSSRRVDDVVMELVDSDKGLEKGGMAEEVRWTLQMYERELMDMCGGLRVVDKQLLPLGILTILRKRKVAWQMVL